MKPPILWFSENLIPANAFFSGVENRAFRYGDGVFETIKISEGRPCFISAHRARLRRGLEVLGINPSCLPEETVLGERILEVLNANAVLHGKCRVFVYRKGEGLDCPESNEGEMLIQAMPDKNSLPDFSVLSACLAQSVRIMPSDFNEAKTLNRQVYVRAAMEAKQHQCDTSIIMNAEGRLSDSVSSNIYLTKADGKIYLPPISEGAIPGVARAVLLEILTEQNLAFVIKPLTLKDLDEAEEFFLSNVIRGIQAIKEFRNLSGSKALKLHTSEALSNLWGNKLVSEGIGT